MKKLRLLGTISACVAAFISTSSYASIIIYDFTGTVTEAGNIAGVSASLNDTIVGEFAYDTSTLDSNPGDTTIGEYIDFTITPSSKITLPSGSITFDSFTSVFVTVDTSINIAAGAPDPTVSGNNLDHDITFSLKSTSTALATDSLPTSINLNDFYSATGSFSSFSLANGPAGDPISYSIDTLTLRTVSTSVPDILGQYTGSYSIDVTGCSDSTMDGTYHGSLSIDITTQTNDTFSGSATGTLTVDSDTGVEYIQLSGTITSTGDISGASSHTFFNTAGTGTFIGRLIQDTLTIENTGQDTVGDICSYVRHMTATRPSTSTPKANTSWLPLLLE